ncbi:hypothetical protein [Burkholderia phage vB_BglM_WTB]
MKVFRRSEHKVVAFGAIPHSHAFEANGILYIKVDASMGLRVADSASKATMFEQTYKVKKVESITYAIESISTRDE